MRIQENRKIGHVSQKKLFFLLMRLISSVILFVQQFVKGRIEDILGNTIAGVAVIV